MFDFDHFNVRDLASTVRKSGLYPSDKIIERMEQISEVKERGLLYRKEQLEDLEQETYEALSVKDQEIRKLRKEKKSLEEALNRKKKIEEQTIKCRLPYPSPARSLPAHSIHPNY